ncbi:MAG TPA: glycosyltransferase [Thermoanaerobaculia bacterium]|nr:glycosyltransferase [Thermoanaerobaculia bacterium]
MRFLFYSHDGLGLGHTRRNLALADAITRLQPNAAVLVATSVQPISFLGIPQNVGILKLPGIRKVNNDFYVGRRLPISLADHVAIRSAILRAAVESFRPDVLLADKHPFGVGNELLPALEVTRRRGGRTALGLRDIIDDPPTVGSEWERQDLARRIPEHYDRVLVYGCRDVFDPIAEYGFPPAIAEKTVFCGYVVNRTRRRWRSADALPSFPEDRPTVLGTAGGGQDGIEVLDGFLKASAGAGWNSVVVCGPQTHEGDRRALEAHALDAGAAFRSFLPGLAQWFGKVDALVSMGGYNTLVEAVRSGTPTVCVPRVVPRTEQLLRAKAFARLGLLRLLPPERLEPESLRREIAAALNWSRGDLRTRARAALDFDGALHSGLELLELAGLDERGARGRAMPFFPGAA